MPKVSPNLVITLLAFTPAWVAADTRLVMEENSRISTPGANDGAETRLEYTLWFEADRTARIDGDTRMVARMDRGELYMIDDSAKTVRVLDLKSLPPTITDPPNIEEADDQTRTIGGWRARRYDLSFEVSPGRQGTMVLWISDELDLDMDSYRAFSRAIDGGSGLLSSIASLPGYPVLQEADLGFVTSTTRLIAADEGDPPKGIYEIPEGYTRQ